MNILFLSGDLCDGGAQRVTATIASKLAENGNNVSLIVFCKSERDYPVSSKVHIIYMSDNIEQYNNISHIKRLFFIRKHIKNIKPDVAIGFLQAGYALYFASLGMKVARVASARVSPEKIMHAKGLISSITRYWFKHADIVVLQNEEQLEMAKEYGWRDMAVIPNPLNENLIRIKIKEYNENCKRFVMVGRLVTQKNYMLAINAMQDIHKLYPDITLDIFGEGKMREELQSYIDNVKLNEVITLKGWSENITMEYLKYDAYILTSNFEGQPNSLMEAMASGLPCISTSCKTGPKELIDNYNNGILIEPDSLDQLIEAMKMLIIMDKKTREKIGKKARKDILLGYNVSNIASKWERMFESIRK